MRRFSSGIPVSSESTPRSDEGTLPCPLDAIRGPCRRSGKDLRTRLGRTCIPQRPDTRSPRRCRDPILRLRCSLSPRALPLSRSSKQGSAPIRAWCWNSARPTTAGQALPKRPPDQLDPFELGLQRGFNSPKPALVATPPVTPYLIALAIAQAWNSSMPLSRCRCAVAMVSNEMSAVCPAAPGNLRHSYVIICSRPAPRTSHDRATVH